MITSEQMYIKHLPPKKCIIAFSQPQHFGEEEPQRFLAYPRTGTTAQTDLGILPYGIELILEPSPNGSGHYDHLRRHGSWCLLFPCPNLVLSFEELVSRCNCILALPIPLSMPCSHSAKDSQDYVENVEGRMVGSFQEESWYINKIGIERISKGPRESFFDKR